MSRPTLFALLMASAVTMAPLTALAAPKAVASIKPVHSLLTAIMKGVGEPGLIVEGSASPHTYQMKPSDAARLQDADVVFWVGHDLEAFLEKPLASLAGNATVVALDDAQGLEKLPFREGGPFEAHDHGHEHDDHHEAEAEHAHGDHDAHEDHDEEAHHHEEGEFDMHLWLSTENARKMAATMAQTLEQKDPENAATYKANLAELDRKLTDLHDTVRTTVAPIKDKPFIVFHDAYQYFEHEFGVKVAGSITVSPEKLPGAERLATIHGKVKELGATCVFAEPQFEPRVIETVIEGTGAKRGTLDPEGGALIPGEALYFDLMTGIADSLRDCLSEN